MNNVCVNVYVLHIHDMNIHDANKAQQQTFVVDATSVVVGEVFVELRESSDGGV